MRLLQKLSLYTATIFGVAVFSSTAVASDWIYTVVDGDNLWDVSERYLGSPLYYEQLRRINNIKFPKRMRPGTRIRVPMKWIKSNPVSAHVLAIEGQVELIRADGSAVHDLTVGEQIKLGDQLVTAADSSAGIEFADGSVITTHSGSSVRFDQLSAYGKTGMVDSRLRLLDGRLDTRVKPAVGPGSRFEIYTPSAISAVRGTEYRTSFKSGPKRSNFEVLKGRVQVTGARKPQLVGAGFGTLVIAGMEATLPRKLIPKPELAPIPDPIRQLNWPLSWQTQQNAKAYRTEIAKDASFNVVLWDRVGSHPRTALPNLPDGRYHIRVRGIDELNLEGWNAVAELTLDVHPQPPVSLAPMDGMAIRGTAAELQWTASADADGYRLEIADDADFQQVLIRQDNLATTKFKAEEITALGSYFWRVSSTTDDGEVGPAGRVRHWIQKPVPTASDLAVSKGDDGIVASWSNGSPGQSYQIQIADESNFRHPEVDQQVTENQFEIEHLIGQVRYLRIRIIEPDGYIGPWGAIQRIDPPYDPTGWIVPIIGVLGILLL